jgi:high-affinity iron transporter
MLASLIVILREGFEAALIIAVVLAYLRQIGALERARSIWAGAAAAAVVSAAAGTLLFSQAPSSRERPRHCSRA